MEKNVHIILNMQTSGLNQIIMLDHNMPELCWDWAIDLTHRDALNEIKRLYVHHLHVSNVVLVSACVDYARKQANTLRPLAIMDDAAMALELLGR